MAKSKKEKIEELEKELAKLKAESIDLSPLEKYKGKYLYFEGYEGGSVICRPDKFYVDEEDDTVKYLGIRINLNTENSEGAGVSVNPTYGDWGDSFEDFPYFTNAYDFEEKGDDSVESQVRYLENWLRYGKYASCTPDDSRELSPERVKDIILEHLFWYLPTEITGSDECDDMYE